MKNKQAKNLMKGNPSFSSSMLERVLNAPRPASAWSRKITLTSGGYTWEAVSRRF